MTTDSTSETAIFERLVLPSPGITREAAESLLALCFSTVDAERMNALAERARQGILTPGEQHEIDNYERVGHYLAILHSKARIALRDSPHSGS